MHKLGVEDAAGYIQKRYASHNLLQLPGIFVGQTLLQQLDSAIEEALVTHSFVDVSVRRENITGLTQLMSNNYELSN